MIGLFSIHNTHYCVVSLLHLVIFWRLLSMLITQLSRQKISNSTHFDYEFLLLLYFITLCRKVCAVWQYGLWSFQTGYTKLKRFLHKNQHAQRKLLNFENWTSGEP